jgi:hypothetical protein
VRYTPAVHICPVCNTEVPNPVDRKCANGHGLFDSRILATTREQPFGPSFLTAFGCAVAIVIAVTSINGVWPRGPLRAALPLVMIAVTVYGVVALLRGRRWRAQGGPVARLAPRAFGAGAGAIAAMLFLYLAGFIYDLRH